MRGVCVRSVCERVCVCEEMCVRVCVYEGRVCVRGVCVRSVCVKSVICACVCGEKEREHLLNS